MLNRYPYTKKTQSRHFPWTNIILDQADINSYPLAIFNFLAFAHQSMHNICHKYIFKYTATSFNADAFDTQSSCKYMYQV